MSAPRGGPLTGARGPPAAPPARKLTIKPLKGKGTRCCQPPASGGGAGRGRVTTLPCAGGAADGVRGAPPTDRPSVSSFLLSSAAPTLPDDFEAATWARLLAAVDAVFAKQPAAASFEDLYRVSERGGAKPGRMGIGATCELAR